MRFIVPILLLALALTGCAEANSIYRTASISGFKPHSITVDAKQRLILSQIRGYSRSAGGLIAIRAYCAEPSPDAFTVLAQSASGGGSLGLDRDAKTLNAALQSAFSNAETGTTIPRTQTLNMLREMMFRTCERYLSGAISDIELPIVAIRDQRVMVSVLAIEQLTGAVTPKPVIVSAAGSAGTGFDPAESMKLLAKARDNLTTADATVSSAEAEFATADSAAGAGGCAQIEKDKADGKTPSPDAAKLKACSDAKTKRDKAKQSQGEAKAFYESQVKLAATGQGVSNASTSTGTVTDPKDWTLAQAQAVQGVAATVKGIVDQTFEQDETQFFCFKQIGDPVATENTLAALGGGRRAEEALDQVKAECLAYLMARVRADRNEIEAARQYGLDTETYRAAIEAGRGQALRFDQPLGARIESCGQDLAKYNALIAAMQGDAGLKNEVARLQSAKGQGGQALARFVQKLVDTDRTILERLVSENCGS